MQNDVAANGYDVEAELKTPDLRETRNMTYKDHSAGMLGSALLGGSTRQPVIPQQSNDNSSAACLFT